MNKDNFGKLLLLYIGRKQCTQCWLAKQIPVKPPMITKWIQGNFTRLDCEKVFKCAEALKLNTIECAELFEAAGCEAYHHQKKFSPVGKSVVPVTTRPILYPHQFFGRNVLLKQILNHDWANLPLQHVIVSGHEKSGKSSLLNYFKAIHEITDENFQCNHGLLPNYHWVLVDFERAIMHRPDNLLRQVLYELDLLYDHQCGWIDLIEILTAALNQPTIILIDNIEKGLRLPELTERFWWNLGALGTGVGGYLGFGIAVQHSLKEFKKLAKQLNKPLHFMNSFTELKLGPFSEEEANELLDSASQDLSKDDIQWILKQSQCWPVLLQVLLKTRLESEVDEDWKAMGKLRLEHYQYLLSDL